MLGQSAHFQVVLSCGEGRSPHDWEKRAREGDGSGDLKAQCATHKVVNVSGLVISEIKYW